MDAAELDVIRRCDAIEADAWVDQYAGAPRELVVRAGLIAERDGSVVMLRAPGLPVAMFNRVIGLGNDRPIVGAEIDEIVACYRAAGSPMVWIHVGPAARPDELPMLLEGRGLVLASRRSWAKVVRGTAPPPTIATTLDVRPIGPEHAEPLASVLAAAHGMPPALVPWIIALVARPGWASYAAFDGAHLVAGGLMYLSGDTAWLGFGGTLPSHRGRGAQGALMARRIADAISAGCTTIATETGEPIAGEQNSSLANMDRCGFRRVCSRLNYTLNLA